MITLIIGIVIALIIVDIMVPSLESSENEDDYWDCCKLLSYDDNS